MNSKYILDSYIPIAEFLGEALGSNCEVVLHDVRNDKSTILTIKNNYTDTCKSHNLLTDLALKILKENNHTKKQYVTKYYGKTKDGKLLKSSTFFIKDVNDEIIGMLCINLDISHILKAKEAIDSLVEEYYDYNLFQSKTYEKLSQNYTSSIKELVMSIIEKTLAEINIPPERMSTDEKISIVHKLDEQGVFLLKGAVSEVASQLKTSENTVYRYLNKENK